MQSDLRLSTMAPQRMSKHGNGSSWNLLLNNVNERLMDEEDVDFASDVYALAESTHDELLNSWKVFTALKDGSDQGRRLENAAWRLQAMQKLGRTPSLEATSKVTGGRCTLKETQVSEESDRLPRLPQPASAPDSVGKLLEAPHDSQDADRELAPILDDSWAAKGLLGVCLKHKLSNEIMGEILQAG